MAVRSAPRHLSPPSAPRRRSLLGAKAEGSPGMTVICGPGLSPRTKPTTQLITESRRRGRHVRSDASLPTVGVPFQSLPWARLPHAVPILRTVSAGGLAKVPKSASSLSFCCRSSKEILPPILRGEDVSGSSLSLCTLLVLHPSGCTADQLMPLNAQRYPFFFQASTGSTDFLSAIPGVAPLNS